MIEKIMQAFHYEGKSLEIQKIQTAHRLKLIDFWKIKEGSRVLEIGCGQGDTLAALAFTVGKAGVVHGVDIADENYGAPETLGQAREKLMQSEFGKNIQIDFNFDVMSNKNIFSENEFDYIVLSHCIWYLSDYNTLVNLLKHIRPWGKQLCIAEWNPSINKSEQLYHLKAVTIQAICESFKTSSLSNVRTMFYPNEIEKAVSKSGWFKSNSTNIYSPDMQDGIWEVGTALNFYVNEILQLSDMPDKLKHLLLAQIEELRNSDNIKPLSIYCLISSKN